MATQVSEENSDAAVAAASDIDWSHLARTIGYRDSTSDELRTADMAVYGIRWNRAILTTIATNRITHVHAILRNSAFPRAEYARLAAYLLVSYSGSFSPPTELEEWRSAAAQLSLELLRGWGAVWQASISMQPRGVIKPFDLGVHTPSEFRPISDGFQNAALLRALRTASRAMCSTHVPGNYLVPEHASITKTSLFKAIRARSAQVRNSSNLALARLENCTCRAISERPAPIGEFARPAPLR